MVVRLILFSLLCLGAGGVQSQSELPRLKADDCSWLKGQLPESQAQRLECSWLVAPWFRDGRTFRVDMELFILRVKPLVESSQAPLLVVPGGPGEAASYDFPDWLASELSRDYDIILLDPRGTGFSYPPLDCREARESSGNDWVQVCRERFAARGIDLSAFSLPEVLRDYVDLLAVLDQGPVNVYAHSYGSRLALLLAEAAPDRIRALVLDGVYPPPVNDLVEMARSLDSALERLFADCALDRACDRAFPNLRASFYRTVADLNAAPQMLTLPSLGIDVVVNGNDYVFLLWSWLHDAGKIPHLPAFIASLAGGALEVEPALESALFMQPEGERRRRNESAFLSMRCPEDLAVPDAERHPGQEPDIPPPLAAAVRELVEAHYFQCQNWRLPAARSLAVDPISSDVPSLLFSGAYDPATPARWGDFAAGHLTRSRHVVFPQAGHGALAAVPCAVDIMGAFLSNPRRAPEPDCLAAQRPPDFASPGHIEQ